MACANPLYLDRYEDAYGVHISWNSNNIYLNKSHDCMGFKKKFWRRKKDKSYCYDCKWVRFYD